MSWSKKPLDYTKETTEELQAILTGLCFKIDAQGYGWAEDMKKYEALITELTRRKVTPAYTVMPFKP